MKKFISLVIAIAIMSSMCLMAIPASAADYNNDAEYQTFTTVDMTLFDMGNPRDYDVQLWLCTPESYHITYFEAKGEFDAVRFAAWSDDLGKQKWLFQIVEEDGETVVREVEQIVKQGGDGINIVKFDPVPAGNYAIKVSTVEDYDPGDNGGSPKYYIVLPAAEIREEYADTCYTEIVGAMTPTDAEAGLILDCVSAFGFGIHLTGNGIVSDTTETPDAEATEEPTVTEEPIVTEEPVATEAPTEEPTATEAPAVETEAPTATAGTDKNDSDKDEGGISTPVLIGIIAGAVVIVAAAAVIIYFLVIKKKK